MKNKKGFTLIEIIISLVLIILIGTITIVAINKKELTEEEQKEKYRQEIILDATVYFENNKDKLLKFKKLKNVDDYAFMQLKELIAEGLLEENLYNPIRKTSSRESDYDCLKVFINNDGNIDIEYPYDELCENKTEVEINKLIPQLVFIHLNKKEEKISLPESEEIYKSYLDNNSIISDIKNGDYLKHLEDEGMHLLPDYEVRDRHGNVINYEENLVKIDNQKVYDEYGKWTKKWKYIYKFDEEIAEKNGYIAGPSQEFIIEQVDEAAPIVVYAMTQEEYLKMTQEDYLKMTQYGYSIDVTDVTKPVDSLIQIFLDGNYNDYNDVTPINIAAIGSKNYFVFDNYDGVSTLDIYDYYEPFYSEVFLNYRKISFYNTNIELIDSSKNKSNYDLKFTILNSPPSIYMDTDVKKCIAYQEFNKADFDRGINIVDPDTGIYKYIKCNEYNDDNNRTSCSYSFTPINITNTTDSWYMDEGDYELNVTACDKYSCSKATYDIKITELQCDWPNDIEQTSPCPSILNQMKQNSSAWHDANTLRDRLLLHYANESLNEKLKENNCYSGDYDSYNGYWINESTGNYLY